MRSVQDLTCIEEICHEVM